MKKILFLYGTLPVLTALVFFAGARSHAGETVQVNEDFLRPAARASEPLNGFAAKEGNQKWEATKNLFVISNNQNAHVSVKDDGIFQARLTLPEKARSISVEADMKAISSGDQQTWVAIGLGTPVQFGTLWPSGVFLLLNTRGEFECYYVKADGKTRELIKRAKINEFNPDQMVTLHLEFNSELQTLGISINGRSVLSDYELANKNLVVEPKFAGFSGYAQKSMESTVTRFQLSVQP